MRLGEAWAWRSTMPCAQSGASIMSDTVRLAPFEDREVTQEATTYLADCLIPRQRFDAGKRYRPHERRQISRTGAQRLDGNSVIGHDVEDNLFVHQLALPLPDRVIFQTRHSCQVILDEW